MNDIKGEEFRPKIGENVFQTIFQTILYYVCFDSIIKFYNFVANIQTILRIIANFRCFSRLFRK